MRPSEVAPPRRRRRLVCSAAPAKSCAAASPPTAACGKPVNSSTGHPTPLPACGERVSEGRLTEEVAQGGGKVLWIVALHGVAGLGDCDVAAVRQPRRQPRGVLFVKHIAFGAAHDKGRTGY